jgi:NADH dehydrogenase
MTAQHAERQGRLCGRNVAADLHGGVRTAYRHHDLGFLVDLAGAQAAANPLKIPLSGVPAKIVTRGYHLLSMPGNRLRTTLDWVADTISARQSVHLGLVSPEAVPLETATPELPRR